MNAKAYTNSLISYKKVFMIAWGVMLVLLSVIILSRLLTAEAIVDNSVGVWFDANDPEIQEYNKYNADFGTKEWTILVIKTKSIYEAQFLHQLNKITREVERVDNVIKVTSITNVRDNWFSDEDGLDYRQLYSVESAGLSKSDYIDKFKKQLASNSIFNKNLINLNDDRYTTLLIQNDNFINDPSRYRINIVNSIEKIVSQHDLIEDWGLAGTTVVNAELNKAAQKDVVVFYLLVSILLTVICWKILRSIRDMCVVLGVVVTSVMSSMAFLAVLEIPYNMATVMLPPILIALSVAGVLHIITDFHIAHRDLQTGDALHKTLLSLWVPSMWAMITTSAGLCSFSFSDVSPIFQLGMFGAFGMLVAWFTNMTIAPILLHVLWLNNKKPRFAVESFSILQGSKNIFTNYWFIGLFLILLAVALVGLTKAEIDTDYSKFFAKIHA